jgi:hypothetical protein
MTHEAELALAGNAPPPLDTAGKRALIEKELRDNPNRSEREIARAVGHGVDHKTVAAHRERLGIASPLGNLATGGLGDAVAAQPGSSVQAVVNNWKCPPPPGVVDPPKYDPFDPKEGDLVVPHQPAIAVYENTSGAVVIIQAATDYQGDDPIILVRAENLDSLICRLRTFLP